MRLQKNTLLALYSAIEFAIDPARHISAAEIADKHGVSPHHLAKVLSELTRAGMVESVRGVGGGYRFAGNARRLTLMDIIQLFEDFDAPGAEQQAARPAPRDKRSAYTGRNTARNHPALAVDMALGAVFSEIDQIAKATFSSITLATMLQLIERQQGGATMATRRANTEPGMAQAETPVSRHRKTNGGRNAA